jgi:hypothetical protein
MDEQAKKVVFGTLTVAAVIGTITLGGALIAFALHAAGV